MTASRIILIPKVGATDLALNDLSDVAITAAASGDILRHNGTAWVDTPGTTHFVAQSETRDYFYQGAGDGVTNHDGALDAIVVGGDIRVHFGPGEFLFESSVANDVLIYLAAAGTTLKGSGVGVTTFTFKATDTGFHSGILVGTSAHDCVVEDLTIQRGSNYTSIMVNLQGGTGIGCQRLTFRNCKLDGADSTYAQYSHCVGYANTGTYSDLVFEDVAFANFDYAFLMDVAATGVVDRIRVTNCTFTNCGFDVNAPLATVRDVVVSGCRFTGDIGYACGLAHVEGATIANNHFVDITGEALHVEDYSTNVAIYGNKIIDCNETTLTAPVYIFDSNNIDFFDNDIVNTAETGGAEKVQLYVLGLESGTTAGGRARLGATYNINIHHNRFSSGPNGAILMYFTGNYAIDHNHFQGGLAISDTHVETGTNVREAVKVVSMESSDGGSIQGNKIQGYRSATWRSTNSLSFSDGTVIANNVIRQCRHGIQARNTKSCVIANNMIFRCIYPLSVGPRGGGGDGIGCYPYSLSGNVLFDNKYAGSFDGRLTVVSAGTATVGTGKTLTVVATDLDMPQYTRITFAGGGVLTLTSAADADSTSLSGTVSVASIASGEAGTAVGIVDQPYGTGGDVSAIGPNVDTVAGTTQSARARSLQDPNLVQLTSGEMVVPRAVNIAGNAVVAGQLRLASFTATKTEVISQIRLGCQFGATGTLVRFGVWTVNAAGDLVDMVASTPNDATLLTSNFTNYTKSFTTPFLKVLGQRYAVGVLVVGANPTVYSTSFFDWDLPDRLAPWTVHAIGGQTDLPATAAVGTLGSSKFAPQFVLLP